MGLFGPKKIAPPSLRAHSEERPLDETMIVINDVHKRWVQDDGEVRGLHGIDFSVRAGEFVFITGPTGHGKALASTEPVYTPTGPVPIGELNEGDEVIAGDGSVTTVEGVFPQGVRELYEVRFSDGSVVTCDLEHLWPACVPSDEPDTFEPRSLGDLREDVDAGRRVDVPVCGPVAFSGPAPAIDAFALGALAVLRAHAVKDNVAPGYVQSNDTAAVERIAAALPHVTITTANPEGLFPTFRIDDPGATLSASAIDAALRAALTAPESYRRALMDGFLVESASGVLEQLPEELAQTVAQIARSLGAVASVVPARPSTVDAGGHAEEWYVIISRPGARTITSITKSVPGEAVCIAVAHPSHQYLTRNFVVTHNTSTLRLLRGQSDPDKGQVLFGGKPVSAYNSRLYKRSVALVSQDFDILPLQTVAENIAMPLQYLRYHPDDIAARVDALLKLFALEHKRGSLAGKKLSGGERQRLAIARAIAHEPDVLLCDEPTGNLDPRTTYGVLRILNRIAMGGTTVICVTHDQHVVDLMGKRTIVIDSGRIVADRIASPRLDLAVDATRHAADPAAVLSSHDDGLLPDAEVTEAMSPAAEEGMMGPDTLAGSDLQETEAPARPHVHLPSDEGTT